MTFELEIYNKLNRGERVYTFQQFLFNKLPANKMHLNEPYNKVKRCLLRVHSPLLTESRLMYFP